MKPVEGAGSDGVFICDSPDEVRRAYQSLEGTKNVLGLTNYSVLLQARADSCTRRVLRPARSSALHARCRAAIQRLGSMLSAIGTRRSI